MPAMPIATPASDDASRSPVPRRFTLSASIEQLLVAASLIEKLRANAAAVGSVAHYLSDHGESPGEGNLFLHGMPYLVAPDEQLRVPMLMWLSAGFEERRRLA